jgi:hypothetical protein
MRQKKIVPVIIILTLITGFIQTAFAGDLVTPRLDGTYEKMPDGTKKISVSLSASIDDKRVYIENAPLQVSAENETGKTLLGSAVTNLKGKAFFEISPGKSIPEDKEGYYTFVIQYEGNQKFNITSKTIRVKELFLEISFPKSDSIINVQVSVSAKNDKGVKETVQEIPVEFYVKRLFGLFKFGSEKTDASGLCTAEFPKSLPGDTTGKAIIVAKVLDNEFYGTVGASVDFKKATPLILVPKQKRGLGDTDAPLWMVYTLLVLLTGVWFHVIYVIGLVIRINIKGKKALNKPTITE